MKNSRSQSRLQNRSRLPCSTASCGRLQPSTSLKQLTQCRAQGPVKAWRYTTSGWRPCG